MYQLLDYCQRDICPTQQEILTEVKKTLQISNPDYDLVLDRLHL